MAQLRKLNLTDFRSWLERRKHIVVGVRGSPFDYPLSNYVKCRMKSNNVLICMSMITVRCSWDDGRFAEKSCNISKWQRSVIRKVDKQGVGRNPLYGSQVLRAIKNV